MKIYFQKLGSRGFYKNIKFWVFYENKKISNIYLTDWGKKNILSKKSKSALNFELNDLLK